MDKSAVKEETIFENLFKMSNQPLYVDPTKTSQNKNSFLTIFSALENAFENNLIKLNSGLYQEHLELTTANVRIQSLDPASNAIIANEQYPSVTVDLPSVDDKVFFQYIKLAHLCEHSQEMIRWPNLKNLRETKYKKIKIGPNLNTNIIIKKGTLQLDQCKISLSARKDSSKLVPCIVVEEEGCLIMNRCEVVGGAGTIGIVCKGGKVNIRESIIKDHGGIGVLVLGSGDTSCILKNSLIQNCNEGVILNGPFLGSIQNNIIKDNINSGITTLFGNKSNILSNQITLCKIGVEVENSCPKIMKNSLNSNREYGLGCYAKMGYQCWPFVKFNTIEENKKGGAYISGNNNKTEIFNNIIKYNYKFGVKVDKKATSHIFLNEIFNNFENGIEVRQKSTSFIQKNTITGSLNCNIILEGPDNIDNYVYNNKILAARGQGILIINSEQFLIAKNEISGNYNGVLSITSVVNIEENLIENNKNNGVMMVGDNQVEVNQNVVKFNKNVGIVCRDTSRAEIKNNSFNQNKIEILVETDHPFMDRVEDQNQFEQLQYDVRVPKNYSCSVM